MSRSIKHPSEIHIDDYQYALPDERIARYPLEERDRSKLLIYKSGEIEEDIYRNIAEHIPAGSLLFFNQAKVVHARLHFYKSTGGHIEVFCLEPGKRYTDITTAMAQEDEIYWKCLLRGAAKWKDDNPITMEARFTTADGVQDMIKASAEKIARDGNAFLIYFRWKTTSGEHLSFSEFLEHAGNIPIPPYLKRKAEASDEERYQTIFARREGSVAAPTAALHFTDYVLKDLEEHDIKRERLTLHVGAGTFMPVKSETMSGHQMHAEWIEFSLHLLHRIAEQLRSGQKKISIGTTSARTIESLYWIGVQLLRGEWDKSQAIAVSQWYPYERSDDYAPEEAINALMDYFHQQNIDKFITRTRLIIAPTYEFKLIDGLITNFHQPASTLLLMIAALVGEDWKEIYDYALEHEFRFLSYGDGSLLWKQ